LLSFISEYEISDWNGSVRLKNSLGGDELLSQAKEPAGVGGSYGDGLAGSVIEDGLRGCGPNASGKGAFSLSDQPAEGEGQEMIAVVGPVLVMARAGGSGAA